MIRTLHGLDFKVISPSAFLLKSVRDDIQDPQAMVIVAYNGEHWYLHYKSPTVQLAHPFKTRDAAMQLIASRAS
jgi:hypothetical protein